MLGYHNRQGSGKQFRMLTLDWIPVAILKLSFTQPLSSIYHPIYLGTPGIQDQYSSSKTRCLCSTGQYMVICDVIQDAQIQNVTFQTFILSTIEKRRTLNEPYTDMCYNILINMSSITMLFFGFLKSKKLGMFLDKCCVAKGVVVDLVVW